MPPKKSTSQPTVSISESVGTVKIDSFILQIRNLCRARGLQIWNKQSLSDQIYKDILFLYHVPRLQRSGYLNLNVERIGDGKISEPSFKAIMSLKEPALIGTAFKRLWKELQISSVSKLFDSREFAMFPIEKKDGTKYLSLLMDILDYASKVELAPYDSDSGHTYFNKDLAKGLAKTFGQFYTPGAVVKSIIKELALSSKDTVLDPSCGSCSFLQEAGDTLVKKEGLTAETAFKNLYGVEVEPNIYVDGLLNTFTRFGMLPDMEHNIREADAFKILLSEDTQYDKIPANPPFGADAKSFQEFYFKTIMEPKGKKLVKKRIVNPELKFQIPFPHTGESAILFFQIIIQKLKKGGKAGVVMSSTILNDGNKDMIKWFLEQCSLEKVIINPAGTFKDKGTGIETFSFVFTKGKPTTTVSIVMLGAEEIVVRSLTLAEIEAAGWKLQLKEEEKKEIYTGAHELVKLGDIVQRISGKKLTLEEAINGDIPLYSASVKIHRHNESHYDATESIIQACIGSNLEECIHFTKTPFATTGNLWILRKKRNHVSLKYIFYLLRLSKIILKTSSDHSRPMASFGQFSELDIPLPPLPIQQEIVASLDQILADPKDSKDCLAFTDKAMDLLLKDPSGKLLEDVLGGLRIKRAHLANADSVKAQMASVVRSVGQRGYEKISLKTMVDARNGKNIPEERRMEKATYPYYASNGIKGYVNEFLFEGPCVLIGDQGSSWAKSVHYVDEGVKFYAGNHTIVMKAKEGQKIRYIYYLLILANLSVFGKESAIIPEMNKELFYSSPQPNPPLAEQEKVLTMLNEMEAERKVLEKMAAKAEERAKFVLEGYLTPALQEEEFTYNENGEIVFDEEA